MLDCKRSIITAFSIFQHSNGDVTILTDGAYGLGCSYPDCNSCTLYAFLKRFRDRRMKCTYMIKNLQTVSPGSERISSLLEMYDFIAFFIFWFVFITECINSEHLKIKHREMPRVAYGYSNTY